LAGTEEISMYTKMEYFIVQILKILGLEPVREQQTEKTNIVVTIIIIIIVVVIVLILSSNLTKDYTLTYINIGFTRECFRKM
jgi:heme/copper-type cytochrome/quinol oxidase subunit 4